MRNSQTMIHAALLGSAAALFAFSALAGAHEFGAAQKRIMAAHGMRASASQPGKIGSAPAKTAYNFTVLHNFAGLPNDGAGPGAEITVGPSDNIYGTTDYGGANGSYGYGTIFQITPDGTESVLHSFGGSGDGSTPDGAVFISKSAMYGTTTYGGSSENGVIWKFGFYSGYSVLHNFTTDECNFARGRLIQDKKGNFYGNCLFGGASEYGTAIRFTAKGKVTVLHTFDSTDGAYPEHNLVMDKEGNLYGVTAFGGTTDNGSVFELAKDGTFTSLYSFTGGTDGGFPYGGLAIDKDGNLYGSTDDGGANGDGTVFKLAPDETLTTLYNFTGGADGSFPEGDMLLMGKYLYSTTTSGGANDQGGVYEVTLKGKETTLADFSDTNGNFYSAGLTPSGKNFYGTAEYGGTSDNGTVFSLTGK